MGAKVNNESTKQHNRRLRTDNGLSHGGGGLNAFCWYQIFALDSAVVEAQAHIVAS